MPARRSSNNPPSSIAMPILAVGAILTLAACYFKGPFMVVAFIAVAVAAFFEPNVQPTGTKIKGVAQPISDRQKRDIATAGYWRGMRARLVLPIDLIWPGRHPSISWLLAIAGALCAGSVPVVPDQVTIKGAADPGFVQVVDASAYGSLSLLLHVVNGLLAGWLIAALCANARKAKASPGVRLGGVITLVKKSDYLPLGLALAGGIVGAVLGLVTRSVAHDSGLTIDIGWVAGGALAGVCIALYRWLDELSMGVWREMNETTARWSPVWEHLKADPAPVLEDISHRGGSAKMLTWRVTGPKSAAALTKELPKAVHALGTDEQIYSLYAPVLGADGPQYGVVDSGRFRVLTVDSGAGLNLRQAIDADPQLVHDVLEAAMAVACEESKMTPMALMDHESLTGDEQTDKVAYGTRWEPLDASSPSLGVVRDSGAIRRSICESLGVDILVDHRAGALFVGDLLDADTPFEDEGMDAKMRDLDAEDFWKIRWSEGGPSKWKANTPTRVSNRHASAKLVNGTEIIREVFLVRRGVEVTDYFKTDRAMATAMDSASMFTTTGFTTGGTGRAGDRLASGMAVYYAKHGQSVPGMDRLAPASRQSGSPRDVNPQAWVITSMINNAFTDAHLARPEVTEVTPLTSSRSRGHLWKVEIRLHGGVTLADVRAKTPKISEILHVPWLRFAAAQDGCVVYAGVEPSADNLADPEHDLVKLLSMDWEEAFRQSGVISDAGQVPTMSDILVSDTNENLTTLEFELPAGRLTDEKVKGAIPKLRNMTHNDFIVYKSSPKGASYFRLTVCEHNPLPNTITFDVKKALRNKKNPFASDIENIPVGLGLGSDNPHIMYAGLSGSGKSSAAQSALTSVLLGGDDVVIIDPQKNAADFTYLKDRALGWATDYESSLAALRALYAEARQRIQLYTKHGVANIKDLPDDVRPNRIVVFIDEFIGLISPEPNSFDKKSTDPDVVKAREDLDHINALRASCGGQVAKLLGEARSAGIHLVLATQSLSAQTLKSIPGGTNIKNNLARLLLGNSSQGDRQSALRSPFTVPDMGETIPPGRGYWEPVNLKSAVIIQVWYATINEHRELIEEFTEPMDERDLLDIKPFMPKDEDTPGIIGEIPPSLRKAMGLDDDGEQDVVVSEQVEEDFNFDIPDDDSDDQELFDVNDVMDGGQSEPETDEVREIEDQESLIADLDGFVPEPDEDDEQQEPEPTKAEGDKPIGYYVPPVSVPDEW